MSTEPNQVLWRGIRLAHGELFLPTYPYVSGGTQVVNSESAVNESKTVHTVSDGKVFHLSAISLCGEGTGNGVVSLEVFNDAAAFQYHLFCANFKAGELCAIFGSFVPAVTLPEKWEIVVTSSALNVDAHGFVHGFELVA